MLAADAVTPSSAASRIVVIEDNLDAAEVLADVLQLEGYEVHVAHDGRSGLELVRRVRPDLVLCDIGLPDLDGYEVAQALRRDEALGATRLIAVSGYAQPEDRQRALEAGFDEHMAKPLSPRDLMKALAGAREPR